MKEEKAIIEKINEIKKHLENINENIKGYIVDTKEIIIDPRVRFKCKLSGCREYNNNLMCPPNTLSLNEFEEVLKKYTKGIIIQINGKLTSDNKREQADKLALKLHEIIVEGEKFAFSKGFTFAAGLIGGSCKLCKECESQKCINPEKARPSMEAMGVDVVNTLKNLGLWQEFKDDEVLWTGMLLIS